MGGKAGKIVLLAATLWPLVYMFLFMGFILTMVLTISGQPASSGRAAEPASLHWFAGLFIAHILTMLLCIALAVFYVIDVFRNERVTNDQKPLWAIVVLLGGFIGMPIYWYLFMWREPAAAA